MPVRQPEGRPKTMTRARSGGPVAATSFSPVAPTTTGPYLDPACVPKSTFENWSATQGCNRARIVTVDHPRPSGDEAASVR